MKKEIRQVGKYRRALLESEKGGRATGNGPIGVCLVFPSTYHVAMSNLAVHTLYSILNARPDCSCERGFCEEPLTGVSLESGSRLDAFDIVAFTVSFELDYPNILEALAKGRIPARTAERDSDHPLIIAGGPCIFSNPEPLADCFDLCVIGEGEEVIHEIIDAYAEAKERGLSRDALLRRLSGISGVYVPSLFEPAYSEDGELEGFGGKSEGDFPVKARTVSSLDDHPCHSALLTPNTEFSNMFLIELGRGCRRGCRFCSACHIYLRRERSLEPLKRQIAEGGKLADRVGLITSDFADYPQRGELLEFLLNNDIGFSVSSVRADAITEDLLAGMRKTGQRTLTIAPEVATEKLAKFTGKRITSDTLLRVFGMALEREIINFRLYFMIGFPGEDDEDIEAIVALAKTVQAEMRRAAGGLKKIGRLTISINPFVPKPFTPLEAEPFADQKTLSGRMKLLREGLARVGNTHFIAQSPRLARLQAAFARGDRRALRLAQMLAEGQTPAQAMRLFGGDIDRYTGGRIGEDAVRPWDSIEPPSRGRSVFEGRGGETSN